MRALYFEVLSYTMENIALLESHFDVQRFPDPEHVTATALRDADVIFAPLGYMFDDRFMSLCPQLKVIATNTTGVPHIDLHAAARRGVIVVSLKDEALFLSTITPTAELTLGLIIAITRNVFPASAAARSGAWSRWPHGGRAMLSRMSVGIVGLGRLGSMVARYLRCIGAKIRYYDPWVAIPGDDLAAVCQRCDTLNELVGLSDVVTAHVPMEEGNRHMFNAELFSHFKPGAFFVNTARGELVESEALIQALSERRLAGAALDVVDGEFDPGFAERAFEHPLVKYAARNDNLVLTPHIGGSTRDAWAMTQEFTIRRAIEAAVRA